MAFHLRDNIKWRKTCLTSIEEKSLGLIISYWQNIELKNEFHQIKMALEILGRKNELRSKSKTVRKLLKLFNVLCIYKKKKATMGRWNLPPILQYSEACTVSVTVSWFHVWSCQEKLGTITTWLIYRQIYQHLFLNSCCDGQLPSNSLGFATFFFFKVQNSVAGLWYAHQGPINLDKISKVKESNVERPKPLRTSYDTSLKMYNAALLCMSHLILRGCPHGVMVKAMDCGIIVREFIL